MRIFAQILADITRQPRYKVVAGRDFEWANNSLVHNTFRLYELVFGRRHGIRCEQTALSYFDENGKQVVIKYAHTWEALFILWEEKVKEVFAWRIKPFRVYVPVLQTPQGIPIPASPYFFAIAYVDGGENWGGTNYTNTIAFTCSGSNLVLFSLGEGRDHSTPASCSYNGDVYTADFTEIAVAGFPNYVNFFYRENPDTGGSYNSTITWVGVDVYQKVALYSGINTASFPDSINSSGGTATSFTASTTVVATGCWLIMGAWNNSNNYNGGTGTTWRGTARGGMIGDSNGAVGTGSQSLGATWTGGASTEYAWFIVSAPAAAGGGTAVVNPHNLALLGVG